MSSAEDPDWQVVLAGLIALVRTLGVSQFRESPESSNREPLEKETRHLEGSPRLSFLHPCWQSHMRFWRVDGLLTPLAQGLHDAVLLSQWEAL